MHIGIIGWYGKANAGDERILYNLQKFFDDHDLSIFIAWQDAWNRIDELNRCDFVLIGGGGLILPGINSWTKLLEALTVPFGCIGISVETQHSSAAEFIASLKQKAKFILVRDQQSAHILNDNQKVIVGPDLTFLYPYDIVDIQTQDRVGLSLRPWHYWQGELYTPKHYWMSLINSRVPFFERIYLFSKWEPKTAVAILRQRFPTILPIPLNTYGNSSNDVLLLKEFFNTIDSTFSPEHLSTCRYLIGMRLHSLIFACQMGIPFLSLSYMPKNKHFCHEIGLPQLSIPLNDMSYFSTMLLYMIENAHSIREHLLEKRSENTRLIHRQMSQILQEIVS